MTSRGLGERVLAADVLSDVGLVEGDDGRRVGVSALGRRLGGRAEPLADTGPRAVQSVSCRDFGGEAPSVTGG